MAQKVNPKALGCKVFALLMSGGAMVFGCFQALFLLSLGEGGAVEYETPSLWDVDPDDPFDRAGLIDVAVGALGDSAPAGSMTIEEVRNAVAAGLNLQFACDAQQPYFLIMKLCALIAMAELAALLILHLLMFPVLWLSTSDSVGKVIMVVSILCALQVLAVPICMFLVYANDLCGPESAVSNFGSLGLPVGLVPQVALTLIGQSCVKHLMDEPGPDVDEPEVASRQDTQNPLMDDATSMLASPIVPSFSSPAFSSTRGVRAIPLPEPSSRAVSHSERGVYPGSAGVNRFSVAAFRQTAGSFAPGVGTQSTRSIYSSCHTPTHITSTRPYLGPSFS
eukprot:TRINITY_DN845_c1_g1_i1.p1 TRINITY_DN845_c1_g1~~TRINITY_DN845_c1_g1_i1.p1  ORF type:complete len:336 (+),score=38.27 TRINITY_DN845_c1_g1_i1:64-1071(+)